MTREHNESSLKLESAPEAASPCRGLLMQNVLKYTKISFLILCFLILYCWGSLCFPSSTFLKSLLLHYFYIYFCVSLFSKNELGLTKARLCAVSLSHNPTMASLETIPFNFSEGTCSVPGSVLLDG